MVLNSFIQIVSSAAIAILSLVVSVNVNHHLNYLDRSSYGIFVVLLGQIFLFLQSGLPGALTTTGLGPLSFARKREFLQLISLRFIPFTLISLAISIVFQINIYLTLLMLLGYLSLIPSQWLTSAFYSHVSNLEYSLWRVSFNLLQLVTIIVGSFFFHRLDLKFFVISWLVGNFLVLVFACYRLNSLEVRSEDGREVLTLHGVARLGRISFVAHIGISDLMRIEIYLIPLLQPTFYSAKYFAIAGLSNWPRVLVDGISTSMISRYGSTTFQAARSIAVKKVCSTFLIGFTPLVLTWPFASSGIEKLVSSKYGPVYPLFFVFSTTLLLSSLRRLYLDAYRTHGIENSKKASKLEIQSWTISIFPLFLLIIQKSMILWAWLTLFSNLIALCILIFRGQRWKNIHDC